MKNTLWSLLSVSLLLSSASYADVLQLKGEVINSGVSKSVAIGTTATEQVTGANKNLTLVGAGMRKKSVIGIPKSIYVLQFFAEDATKIQKDADQAADSVMKAGVVALRLSFVYGVSADQITTAFSEGLGANLTASEMASEDIQEFLNNTVGNSGSMPNGTVLNIVGYTKDGTEYVAYENNGSLITQKAKAPGLIKKIFSIWLGKIDDSDALLGRLKTELLNY